MLLMANVKLFNHEQFGLFTTYIDDDGKEYFKAHDVCTALKLTNPSSQLKRNVKSKWVFEFDDGYSKSGKALYLSEPGLYALIFRSKTTQAERFQDWVFEEVLPKLRADGYYIARKDAETISQLEAELIKTKKALWDTDEELIDTAHRLDELMRDQPIFFEKGEI